MKRLCVLSAVFVSLALGQKFPTTCYDVVVAKYNPAALPIPQAKGAPSGYQVFATFKPGAGCVETDFVTVAIGYRAGAVMRSRVDTALMVKQADGKRNGGLLATIGIDSEVLAVSIAPLPAIDIEVGQ